MKLSHKQQGHLIMLVVMGIFGLNIPVNKYLYSSGLLSPLGLVALRMLFGTIMFWGVSLFTRKEKVEKKDMLILIIGGLCGMAINQSLFAYGLGLTSPVDASIITTSGPLFTMIIAALILKEPITLKKAGGVFTGGLGAIFLIYTSYHGIVKQDNNLIGDASVLSAQIFYSLYLVITRPLSLKYSPATIMKWMFLFSAIASMPFYYSNITEAYIFRQDELRPFLLLIFVLFGATFLTYMLIPLAQRRIRPTTISMYNNMQPLVASGVAIFLRMDNFTFEKLISALLIFSGVYLVTTSKSKKDLENEKAQEI